MMRIIEWLAIIVGAAYLLRQAWILWKAVRGLERLRADRLEAAQIRRTQSPIDRNRGYIDFSGLMYFGIIIGVVATLAVAFGIPALWHLLKPFLHRVTS